MKKRKLSRFIKTIITLDVLITILAVITWTLNGFENIFYEVLLIFILNVDTYSHYLDEKLREDKKDE